MKLETWTDGNMEIMHVISFCSYVKNSGCYGNKYINKNTDNGGVSPVGDHIAWQSLVLIRNLV